MGYSWDEVYSNGWISSKTMDCIPTPIPLTEILIAPLFLANWPCRLYNQGEGPLRFSQI